jgi:hypothetical protein
MVMAILKAFPQAASEPCAPDERSVLSIAAESKSVSPEVLKELILSRPACLRHKDPVLRLYPFQVAALPKPRSITCPKFRRIRLQWDEPIQQEELLQLTAIFELMVAAPDLLQAHFGGSDGGEV